MSNSQQHKNQKTQNDQYSNTNEQSGEWPYAPQETAERKAGRTSQPSQNPVQNPKR